MSVTKRNNGRYVINFYYRNKRRTFYSPVGSRTPFQTYAEAREYQTFIRAKIMREEGQEPLPVTEGVVLSFFNELKRRLKPSTAYAYEKAFRKYWYPHFGGADIHRISQRDLQLAADEVFSHGSNTSNIAGSGLAFARFLREFRHDLDIEPFRFRTSGRIRYRKKYEIYTIEQFKEFFKVIKDPLHQAAFAFLYFFGLRVSELRGLCWSDIEGNQIHINKQYCDKTGGEPILIAPKTARSNRNYPLEGLPKTSLESLPRRSNTFVFALSDGKPIGTSTLRRLAIRYAKEAKLNPLKIHEFRHSCVSHLIKMGQHPRIIASWIGDTLETTLNVYCHAQDAEKASVITSAFGF